MTLSQLIWQSPVAAASTVNVVGTFAAISAGNIATTSTLTQPTGGTHQAGNYTNVKLTGGTGTGALATVTVTTTVTSVVVTTSGSGYVVGDVLTYSGTGVGTGGTITVATVSATGPGDTLTAASNAVLVVDTYTPVLNDRLLLKNQTTGLQNGIYNISQLNASGIISSTTGPVASVGNITQPTGGTITPGNYTAIALTGGSGTGAVGTVQVMSSQVTSVVVTTPGTGYHVNDTLGFTASGIGTGGTVKVLSTGATVQPTGGTIKNGAYLSVPLTGGTGTGARATIVVAANAVTEVNIVNPGINYVVGDVLHYDANGQGFGNGGTVTVATVTVNPTPVGGTPSNGQAGLILTVSGFTQPTSNFVTNGTYGNFPLTGGSGTGATATISINGGVVTSVVITNPGTGYTAANSLGFTGTINTPTQGLGSGGTITVPTVTFNPWILTRAPDANLSIQLPGLAVFAANGSQANTAWVQNAFPVTIDTTALTFVAFSAL